MTETTYGKGSPQNPDGFRSPEQNLKREMESVAEVLKNKGANFLKSVLLESDGYFQNVDTVVVKTREGEIDRKGLEAILVNFWRNQCQKELRQLSTLLKEYPNVSGEAKVTGVNTENTPFDSALERIFDSVLNQAIAEANYTQMIDRMAQFQDQINRPRQELPVFDSGAVEDFSPQPNPEYEQPSLESFSDTARSTELPNVEEESGVYVSPDFSGLQFPEETVEEKFEETLDFDYGDEPAEIPQSEKRGPIAFLKDAWKSLQERKKSGDLSKEYQEVLDILDNGGALQVMLVDDDGKAQGKAFWISPTSTFAVENGLTSDELREATVKKREKGPASYIIEGTNFAILISGRDSTKGTNAYERRMQENPVGLLIENTGAEKAGKGVDDLDRFRIGAGEVQKMVTEVAEQIETALGEIESLVSVVDGITPSEDILSNMNAGEVRTLENQQQAMVRTRLEPMASSMVQIVSYVNQARALIERYGDWNEDTLQAESPLQKTKKEFDQVINAFEIIVENISALKEKGTSKKDKQTILVELRQLFSLTIFREEIRAPLVEFFQLIRTDVVELYKDKFTDETAIERAGLYFEGLGLQEIPGEELYQIGLKLVPNFDENLAKYDANLRKKGIKPDEAQKMLYGYMYAQIFGRYESVIQSGYNRILSNSGEMDSETRAKVFDAYTNVVEESAHREYAKEELADVITPLLYRALFIMTQDMGSQLDNIAKFKKLGILPDNLNIQSGALHEYIKSWMSANEVNNKPGVIQSTVTELRNYVGQYELANSGFEDWVEDRESAYPLLDARGLVQAKLTGTQFLAPPRAQEVENIDIDTLLDRGYMKRVNSALLPGQEFTEYMKAVGKLKSETKKLQDILPPESAQLVEVDDILEETKPLHEILISIADIRDGRGDGEIVSALLLDTTRRMNELVDMYYGRIADITQQNLANYGQPIAQA